MLRGQHRLYRRQPLVKGITLLHQPVRIGSDLVQGLDLRVGRVPHLLLPFKGAHRIFHVRTQ